MAVPFTREQRIFLKTETDKQHKYWFESRLKSVKRRIIAITNVMKNG